MGVRKESSGRLTPGVWEPGPSIVKPCPKGSHVAEGNEPPAEPRQRGDSRSAGPGHFHATSEGVTCHWP